jgi:hypothetical protein
VRKEVLKEKRDAKDRKRRVQEDLAAPVTTEDVAALDTALTYNPGSNNNGDSEEEVVGFSELVVIIRISSLYYLLSSFIYIGFQPS